MRSNNVVIVRKYLFEKDFICKVYEIESFTIFFWIEFLVKIVKMVVVKIIKFFKSFNLKFNYL